MVIRRSVFFLALFVVVISPFLVYKAWWLLSSQKTTGTMHFIGKSITGQLAHYYSCISFRVGKDTVFFNTADNVFFKPGERVQVRYRTNKPSDARAEVFADLWGDTVVYGGIMALLLLVIFLHPQIIPFNKKVRLAAQRPFIQVI